MTKALDTLIKLNKRTLDELRRSMVALENQKAQLLQAKANLQQELEQEMELAGTQPEMSHFFGDFAKRIKKRQADLSGEVAALDQQMAQLSDAISFAFAEVKKFEIAKENAKKRAQELARKREDLMMDEIASQQFHRKKDEP